LAQTGSTEQTFIKDLLKSVKSNPFWSWHYLKL